MSNDVENRVVQLEMRNSSLEKGANQSIKTLDKLDKALDLKNGKRSFEDVEKAAEKCNFEPLLKAADAVSNRFSTMGIIGVRALERITDKAVDAGLALTKSLTVDQIAAGYSKYEQKTASVQTLINSTGKSIEEVNGYLARLMWFSDETSYGFSDMTQALATMTSSGGDIDKLIPMIEGVANAVAFAGKGASEFQRVMYNLNQSYSGGYLTYMDWKSVQLAGAASKQLQQIFIDTAVSLGKIKEGEVTLDNFATTLQKKWADRDVMEKAFGYFDEMTQKAYEMIGTLDDNGKVIETASRAYEILAEQYDGVSIRAAKAAQEAKTFGEAIDATKDAVSSGWMRIFESIFGNYEQQKELWTGLSESLYDIFAAPLDTIGGLIDEAFQETPVNRLANELTKTGVSFDDFKAKITEVADTCGAEIGDSTDKVRSFGELLSLDWVNTDIVTKTLDGFRDIETGVNGCAAAVNEINAIDLAKRLNAGEFGHGIAEMTKNLRAAGFDIESAQDVYNKAAHDAGATIQAVSQAVGEAVNDTSDVFKDAYEIAKSLSNEYYTKESGWKIGWDAVKNVLGAIIDRINAVKKAWSEVFPAASATSIKNAIISFHKWSETLKMGEEEGKRITAVAKRIFEVLYFGVNTVKNLVAIGKLAFRFVKKLFSIIASSSTVQKFFDRISNTFDKARMRIKDWCDDLSMWFETTSEDLLMLDWDTIINKLTPIANLAKSLWSLFKRAAKAIKTFATNAAILLWPIGGYLYDNIIAPFSDFIAKLIESDDPIRTLKDGIISLGKKAKAAFDGVVDAVKQGKIAKIFGDFLEKLAPVTEKFDGLEEALDKVIAKAKEVTDNLDLGQIISIATIMTVIIILSKLAEAFKNIGDAAGSIKKTFSNLNNIISAKFGNSFASNAKALAGAVVAIAASLYILSKIPKEELARSAIVLGAMMAVLAAIAGVMTFVSTKLSNKMQKKLNNLTKPLLALSAAMLILSFAARNAAIAVGSGEVVWQRVGAILAVIGGVGLELVGLAALMGVIGGKISVGAVVMMFVAVAILKLVQALKLLENLKLSEDTKGIVGLIVIVTLLGLVTSALTKSKGAFSGFTNITISLLAVIGSIYLIILAIEKIRNFKIEASLDEFGSAMIGMVAMVGIVVGGIVALNFYAKKLSEGAKTIAMISVGVLMLTAAAYLMAKMMEKLAAMSNDANTANAIGGIILIALAISAMTAALGYAIKGSDGGKGAVKVASAVLLMTIAVGAMVLLFKTIDLLCKSMTEDEIANAQNALIMFAVLIAGMTIAVGYASKLGGGKGLGIIIGVVAAMVVMVTALIILTNFTWDQLQAGLLAIAGCLVALGTTMLLIGLAVKMAGKTQGGVVGLVGAVLILALVAAGLAVLASFDLGSIYAATVAIGVVLLALAVSMAILGSVRLDLQTALVSIGILATIFLGLWLVIPQITALANLDAKSVLINMGILVAAVVILMAAVGVLAGITAMIPGMSIAMAVVAVVLLAIAVVVGVFAGAMYLLQSIDYLAIATGLMQVALPMSALGGAGVLLIIGALGVIAMAAALVLLGIAGASSAGGIMTFNVVLIALMNTFSAIGNALQNSNGSIIGALANLRDEFGKSADATAESASKLWDAISGKNQNGADLSAITEGITDVIPDAASGITDSAPELGDALTGAVTSAGESASEEATAQGENVGNNLLDSIGETVSNGGSGVVDLSGLNFDLSGLGLSGDGAAGGLDLSSLGANGGADFMNSLAGGITNNSGTVSQAGAEVGDSLTQSVNESIESSSEETSNSIYSMLSNAVSMVDMQSIGNVLSGNFMNSLGESLLLQTGTGDETLSGNFLPLIQSMVDNTDPSGVGESMAGTIATSFVTSLSSNTNKVEVSKSAESLGNEANSGAQKVDTTASGSYWGEGFNNGMWSWSDRIWQTAYDIGRKAVEGVKAGTREGSPCKTTIQSGKFFDEGLIVGINLLAARVQMTAYKMGMRTAQAVEDGIQNGNPDGIVPVLDMSDVYNTLEEFDGTYRPVIKPMLDMSDVDPAYMNMRAFVSHGSSPDSTNESTDPAVTTPMSFSYVQNNYSPKALSRAEIYRQTKNQFSTVKGLFKK